ncbi:Uncharacterised protein family (UPF0227) [Raoultella planticola]|uniref:Uncharacterized protein n=1 Tax=Raoultella planticola TaxID=575 RepID=A0A485CHQ9_RAOPL|nr:Uncharacterised protein family (UPF0227) [Raoultella planticola]
MLISGPSASTTSARKTAIVVLVILSRQDEALDSQRSADLLHHYYEIIWDNEQTPQIQKHLPPSAADKSL